MNEDQNSGYRRLNPKARVSMYIGNIIAAVIWLAIAYIAWGFIDGMSESFRDLLGIGLLVLTAAIIVYLAVGPLVYYARYRYIITDDAIDIRKGIVILRHIVVPIERVHQVEVVRGPINNLFGLADLQVTTAGGQAEIEYLDNDVADSIADDLNRIVNSIVRGRNEDA